MLGSPKVPARQTGHAGEAPPVGFAQRRDLQIERSRIDARVIVRQHIERHHSDLCEQLVERPRIDGRRNVVAVTGPD
jgi:hypothetical protein